MSPRGSFLFAKIWLAAMRTYFCVRRERAEAVVLLTSDKITKSKHETPLNASEQDKLHWDFISQFFMPNF